MKNNGGGTERALGNLLGKELAQAENRHPWLAVQLFEKSECFVVFLVWSTEPSLC